MTHHRTRQHTALLLVMLIGSCVARTQAANAPNIILMVCDDLRHDALGCIGNEVIRTPHIDSLAEEGVTFDNAFAVTAICMTSRANIFTGRYARRTGLYHGGDLRSRALSEAELAMSYPGILKRAGYHIGYIGKYHLGKPPEGFFDYNGAYRGQGRYWSRSDREKHLTEHIGDRAVEAIERAPKDQPFLFSIGFKTPNVQDGFNKESYPPHPGVATRYETHRFPAPPLSDPVPSGRSRSSSGNRSAGRVGNTGLARRIR